MTLMKNTRKTLEILAFIALIYAAPVAASEVTGTISTSGNGGAVVVAAPSASPIAGTYTGTQSVALTASNADTIYYTTDGTTPVCGTGTLYSGALSVSDNTTVRALSCYSGGATSSVTSFAYVIEEEETTTTTGGGGGGGGGGIILDTTAPTVTLLGDNPLFLQVGDTYTDPGAQVVDNRDYASSITTTVGGDTVNTAIEGTYYVSYVATDSSGNSSEPVIRDVHVGTPSVATITPTVTPPTPTVGGGQVLGASTFKFLVNLHIGMRHDDVYELQNRLTAEGFYQGPVTGYFGELTKAAVIQYQQAHGITPDSGYVGPLTRGELNSTTVPTQEQAAAATGGLTDEQRAAIQEQIDAAMQLLNTLMAQLAAML